MIAILNDFLKAKDLNDLLEISSSLLVLSNTDNDQIKQILQSWELPQEIANLLMYPNLIPEDYRFLSLFKGLQSPEVDYYPLAAIVGLEKINPNSFSEEFRTEVFDSLLGCIETEVLVIIQRGTIALAQYKMPHELDRIARWLNYPDDIVRHNILATLIDGNGLLATQERLTLILDSNRLSSFNRPFLELRLAEIERCLINIDNNSGHLLTTSLTTTKLPYIPNLIQWKSFLSLN